jgi:cold shock CspA family protein
VCSFSRYGGYGFIQQDGVQKHKNNNAYFANNKLEPGVLESMRLNRKVVFKLKIGNGIRPTAYNIAFLSP